MVEVLANRLDGSIQQLTLSGTPDDLILNAGDSLAIDFTGILTWATGQVTLGANPR